MDILFSTLAKFRSSLPSLFSHNKDAALNLVDSLTCDLSSDHIVELSLNPEYQRHYSSIAQAISSYYKPRTDAAAVCLEAKTAANKRIENTLCKHLHMSHSSKHNVFAIDVTPCKRPYSPKLEDKGFVHVNEPTPGKKPVAIGHKYSCVTYLTQEKHWAPPLGLDRVPTSEKETVFGVKQWCNIINDEKNGFTQQPSFGLYDAAYSNPYIIDTFNQSMSQQAGTAVLIARLRADRILARPSKEKANGKRGRNASYDHSNPFKLTDESTWGSADREDGIDWVTARGKEHKINIKLWNNIRMKSHVDANIANVPLTIVRIAVTDKDGRKIYKNPLWLVVVGNWLEEWGLNLLWEFYYSRFDIEHFFRYGKQRLLMDAYQTPENVNEENWMQFVMLAYHQLYHSRYEAKNLPKPWEQKDLADDKVATLDAKKVALSPSRVKRDMPRILASLPQLAADVKPRGISMGRKAGMTFAKRADSKIILKSAGKNLKKWRVSIIWTLKGSGIFLKPRIKYDGVEESVTPQKILDIFSELKEMPPLSTSPPT